jgi:hypothetical protein
VEAQTVSGHCVEVQADKVRRISTGVRCPNRHCPEKVRARLEAVPKWIVVRDVMIFYDAPLQFPSKDRKA